MSDKCPKCGKRTLEEWRYLGGTVKDMKYRETRILANQKLVNLLDTIRRGNDDYEDEVLESKECEEIINDLIGHLTKLENFDVDEYKKDLTIIGESKLTKEERKQLEMGGLHPKEDIL